jgi:FkbM family methyltransferase
LQRRLRYQQARAWEKPWIDPRRFVANQLLKFGVIGGPPGSVHTADAFHLRNFAVVMGEAVSQEIACYGFVEPKLTEALLRLVKPEQVVVDIGMHLGYYATLLALLVGENGEVHGFEPTPSTRQIAQRNTGRFPHIRVHPFAVWSSVKTLAFRDYGPQWMAFNTSAKSKLATEPVAPKEIEVQTITLDQFRASLSRNVALVKIDAESAEREILAGAQALLKSDRPILSVEVGDNDQSRDSRVLVDELIALGYAPWDFAEGRFRPHNPRESYTYDNIIFAPAGAILSSS